MQKPTKPLQKQKGAALILMAFIIGLAVIAYLLHALDPQRLRLVQDKKTMQTLNEAKQALVAWSVSNSLHPGQLPFPDRNLDGNYDGNSDCNSPVSTFVYSFLIGQLPIFGQTNPCISPQVGLAENFKDAQGNRLFYAVSRNLTHKYENFYEDATAVISREPVINPDITKYPLLNPNYNNYPDIKVDVKSYPWLRVVDANGTLVSDKVAAVIFAPGNALGGQNRTGVAPNIGQYLDTFVMSGTIFSNAIYTQPNQAFVIGQDGSTVKSDDTRFVHPYNFNDKLVYITIDELMDAVGRRAAYEASSVLNQYKAKAGHYPYAAPLGAVLANHVSSGVMQSGLVPVDGTDICTCASQLSCSCSFDAITQVTFTRGSGTWTSRTEACTRYSANCNCVGKGSCSNGAENFTCDSAGNCSHNLSGSNSFTYTVPGYANLRKLVVSGCASPVGKQITCDDAGQFAIGLDVPSWFTSNLWQDYFYYEWSSTPSLQVGGKTGVNAILIGVGQAITSPPYASKYIPVAPYVASTGPQGRPPVNLSPSLSDYLDSVENTNGDNIFGATTQQKTSNYNDQTFIVSP
ncbi:MAG: hypothetical protein H7Z20_03905 [Bdellovibrio sp.]|nr:hypothetical protein [Methylotenera sp.]